MEMTKAFDRYLDDYCHSMEEGREDEAVAFSYKAEAIRDLEDSIKSSLCSSLLRKKSSGLFAEREHPLLS